MTFWALPTGADLSHRHVLVLNIIATAIYTLVAIPAGVIWGYLWLTFPADSDEEAGGGALFTLPTRTAVIHGTVWLAAAVLFVVINVHTPWLQRH